MKDDRVICAAKQQGDCKLNSDECPHAQPHDLNMGCFIFQGKCQQVPELSNIRCEVVNNEV